MIIEIIVGLVLFCICYILIQKFPDQDHRMSKYTGNLIVHRSILTHSSLIVFVVYFLTSFFGTTVCFLATSGAAIGLARHLIGDMKNTTGGFAEIHIPVYGRIGSSFSRIWMVLNVLIGFGIALWILIKLPNNA